MSDNGSYFGNVEKKSRGLYIAVAIPALMFLLSVNTDLLHFSQRNDTNVPVEFFWIIFIVDFLVLSMSALMAIHRKAGVILFPFLLMLHFLLHNFYLSVFLLSDLNALFFYFAVGLFALVPRWKYFN
ncbi:MAG: hypothetical protein QM564_13825 [Bergeyella sp.]